MKRKLIKIGDSTLLLSVPREWVKANNLMKGDEIEISQDNEKLVIWPEAKAKKENIVLDVTGFKELTARLLYSMYRRGLDEIELRSSEPMFIDNIKKVVWGETVGFEIIEQGKGYCKIVNVSGKIEDFDNIIRRLFLVTLTMGEEMKSSLRKGSGFQNILYLETESNRLTSMLLRAVNKYGSYGFRKIGPLYYIVQEVERIGDQYKYMAQHFMRRKSRLEAREMAMKLFDEAVLVFRKIYELFYEFSPEKASGIRKMRNDIIAKLLIHHTKKLSNDETVTLHHSLNIVTRAFDMEMSIFILRI